MTYVAEEGFRLRQSKGVIRWICHACNHIMTYLVDGACANCKSTGTLHELKTPERLHDETEAMKDRERFHGWQKGINYQSRECQLGDPLTPEQVLTIIHKWIPGAKVLQQFNPFLGKSLSAFYIPYHPTPEEEAVMMPTEVNGKLKFICCGELKLMPEWDIIPLDSEGRPCTPIRGWRSVLGIFYRAGLIPFIPQSNADRLGWHQIKLSPLKDR